MPTMCLSNSELLENVILHVLQVNLVLLEGSSLAKLDSILIFFVKFSTATSLSFSIKDKEIDMWPFFL